MYTQFAVSMQFGSESVYFFLTFLFCSVTHIVRLIMRAYLEITYECGPVYHVFPVFSFFG